MSGFDIKMRIAVRVRPLSMSHTTWKLATISSATLSAFTGLPELRRMTRTVTTFSNAASYFGNKGW
jgi:hypothetical protein